MELNGMINDGTNEAAVDKTGSALHTSRAIHRRIERSNMWIAWFYNPVVAAAANIFFHIKVGATKNAHGVIRFGTGAAVFYTIYEDPTLTDDGALAGNICQNRQNPAVSTTLCYKNPTITANGTELETGSCGTGGRFTATGAQVENGGYFLLKKGKSYLVKVHNRDAAAQDISITYMWHEE